MQSGKDPDIRMKREPQKGSPTSLRLTSKGVQSPETFQLDNIKIQAVVDMALTPWFWFQDVLVDLAADVVGVVILCFPVAENDHDLFIDLFRLGVRSYEIRADLS